MPNALLRSVAVATVLMTALTAGKAQGFDGGGSATAAGVPVARLAFPPGSSQGAPAQERISVVDPDKKLSAGDRVTVEIVEDREGGLPRVITATGELDVPPLGRVRVAGRTTTDAAASIKQLLERDFYYSATVRLSIDQVTKGQVDQGSVLISGVVRSQGLQTLFAGETLTLAGAILRASPTEWSDLTKVQVSRVKKDGSIERIVVNVKKINETGDAKSDPVLQDGDRVNVPRRIFNF